MNLGWGPCDKAGGLAPGRVHKHPLLAIGDKAKAHAGAVEQGHHACGQGLLPTCAGRGPVENLAGGRHQHQHTGMLAARLDNHQVGGQGLAMLGHRHGEAGEIALGAGDGGLGHQQDAAQHPAYPRLVDGRVALAGHSL